MRRSTSPQLPLRNRLTGNSVSGEGHFSGKCLAGKELRKRQRRPRTGQFIRRDVDLVPGTTHGSAKPEVFSRSTSFEFRSRLCQSPPLESTLWSRSLLARLTLAGVSFGSVFNFTHSARFGLLGKDSRSSGGASLPCELRLLLSRCLLSAMKGERNYRKPMASWLGWIRAHYQARVAWLVIPPQPRREVSLSAGNYSLSSHD
jgi:hypothetical protein